MEVASYLFTEMKKFLTMDPNLELKRITLRGVAGSGKSFFTNTTIATVRKMFDSSTSGHVCAPTGAAAFNSSGYTFHHFFSINPKNIDSNDVSNYVKDSLRDMLVDTVLMIFDERSMISSKILGRCEIVASQCAYGGIHSNTN